MSLYFTVGQKWKNLITTLQGKSKIFLFVCLVIFFLPWTVLNGRKATTGPGDELTQANAQVLELRELKVAPDEHRALPPGPSAS